MHERLSVNTIGFGAVPVADVLDPLDAYGISRIGVPIAQLEAGDLAAQIAALDAAGVSVVDLVEPTVFTLDNPARWPAERLTHGDVAAIARADLGEERFVAAWAAGRALPVDQVIAEALPAGSAGSGAA